MKMKPAVSGVQVFIKRNRVVVTTEKDYKFCKYAHI